MSFIEKIAQEREKHRQIGDSLGFTPANDNAPEKAFEGEYFGIDNIKSFPACLDLRLAEGKRVALPYSYIMGISFDPDEGIEISTASKRINISGRALEKLYDYLTAYRVRYIKAHTGSGMGLDNGLFVKFIEISEL